MRRAEAIKLGLKRYWTGTPCRRGHVDYRITSCGRCVTCHRLQKREWIKTPKGKEVRRRYDRKRPSTWWFLNKRATPPWANLREINRFRRDCPSGYHVDHIIPLNGGLVSGLNVLSNLQYLPADLNRAKANTILPVTLEAVVCPLPDPQTDV